MKCGAVLWIIYGVTLVGLSVLVVTKTILLDAHQMQAVTLGLGGVALFAYGASKFGR